MCIYIYIHIYIYMYIHIKPSYIVCIGTRAGGRIEDA